MRDGLPKMKDFPKRVWRVGRSRFRSRIVLSVAMLDGILHHSIIVSVTFSDGLITSPPASAGELADSLPVGLWSEFRAIPMIVTGTYDPYLVALSILVACFASYTALDLSGHVGPARGYARRVWLVAAALTMGGGIWVDALRRHASLRHADTDVLRHWIDHPFRS